MLRIISHYSIGEGFCHIDDLVEFAEDKKFPYLFLADHHTLSGSMEFLDELKETDILPIIGCSFNVLMEDDIHREILIAAKNRSGYDELVRILGRSKFVDDKPFVHIKDIEELLTDNCVKLYTDTHSCYIKNEDRLYHRILLCSHIKSSFSKISEDLKDHPNLLQYFDDKEFFSLENARPSEQDLFGMGFEKYSLDRSPEIPTISTSPDEDLRQLCREGWKSKNLHKLKESNPSLFDVYTQRIKYELGVFADAGLSNYMLIVHDFAAYAHKRKASFGLRGSGVGCLVSYLLGICDVDPILPDPTLQYAPERSLLFERFFNPGRKGSLPDCDCDVPTSFRSILIDYVRDKYGEDKVSNIITFNRMDGRSAIKEVFRILEPESNSFDIANRITKDMVETAAVQDVLEDLKSEDPKYNIVKYNVEHVEKVKAHYSSYKEMFDIAMKLSGTIISYGKHAAGIVITNQPMYEHLPVLYHKETGKLIAGYEMEYLEQAGCVKFDILGVSALEKIDAICYMINNDLDSIPEESLYA